MRSRAVAVVCLLASSPRIEPSSDRFLSFLISVSEAPGPLPNPLPAYTEAYCGLEQYQKTFEPPYSSRPATGFLLVSFSKVTRHLLALFASTFLAESLPNNAND